jgi:BESS motif
MKIRALIRKFLIEAAQPISDWAFLDQMKSIVPLSLVPVKLDSPEVEVTQPSSEVSAFNMTSISQRSPMMSVMNTQTQDSDLAFLMQLLPEIKQFDKKSKSIFKLQTQTLIHNLKYNELF